MRFNDKKLLGTLFVLTVVLLWWQKNDDVLKSTPAKTEINQENPQFSSENQYKKYGIAFITYGANIEHVKNYVTLAQSSALLYRKHSPGLPIALLTSHPSVLNNTFPFTDIITIPPWMRYDGRQWLTRTQALRTLLPYNLTLVVDSDTIACGDISIPLKHILSSEQSKFAIATGSHEETEYLPDNGIILLNKNAPGFMEIMDVWFNKHIKRGIISDDQRSLHESSWYFENREDVHMGVLHPTISCRWHPGQNQTWTREGRNYDQTLTLNGFVYILHMYGGPSKITDELCNIVNEKPDETRVMVWRDHTIYPYSSNLKSLTQINKIAYSFEECQDLLDNHCYQKLLWNKIRTKKYVTEIINIY